MQLESLPTRKRSLCQTTLTPVDEQIRKNKKPLSLSVFETYASNDETHTLVESKVWTRWRLDVKYLLVISGESARMDGRLIVCVSNAWYFSCWTKQSKKSSYIFFFFFWRESGPRTRDEDRPAMFFSRMFSSVRFRRRENLESESRETRVCSGPRCVIYLFLEARRERGIELPIMFPGIMGCIRVQLTNAAHLIDSRRSPHLFCRVDDY